MSRAHVALLQADGRSPFLGPSVVLPRASSPVPATFPAEQAVEGARPTG